MPRRVFWIDGVTPGRLGTMPRPRGGDWLESEMRALREEEGLDRLVCLLTGEELAELELVEEAALAGVAGIGFHRLPVTDLGLPSDPEAFASLARELAARLGEGESIGVHCRMGIGRSTTLAACVLIERGLGADEALARISRARGLPVPDTAEQAEWIGGYVPEERAGA